jgi:hypothetical protein
VSSPALAEFILELPTSADLYFKLRKAPNHKMANRTTHAGNRVN